LDPSRGHFSSGPHAIINSAVSRLVLVAILVAALVSSPGATAGDPPLGTGASQV
jgi:hypothetical protein